MKAQSIFILLAAILDWSCSFCVEAPSIEGWTLEEKIGQLFMVPACPLEGEHHLSDLKTLMEICPFGGVILKASDPQTQMHFLRGLQSISPRPLLVSQDAEWGLGMRMKGTLSYPKNLTLGAIQDDHWIYLVGKEIGRQCKLVGGHINFAPVVDVNSNPLNPVISMRSFGEDPQRVARKGEAFIRGFQESGLFACAKHFPGHGDTHLDSHKTLPQVDHSRKRLEEVEWVPFIRAIQSGVYCIMGAHLLVPALSSEISSLSPQIMRDILQRDLHFSGLIVSDALNMKALTNTYSPEEIVLKAWEAGTTIFLYGAHLYEDVQEIVHNQVPRAFTALKEGFLSGKLDRNELDLRVKKLLKAKQALGLFNEGSFLDAETVEEELHSPEAIALKKVLFEKAMTLICKDCKELPLRSLSSSIYVRLGEANRDCLEEYFQGIIPCFSWDQLSPDFWESEKDLKTTQIILGVFLKDQPSAQFGLTPTSLDFLQQLSHCPHVLVIVFSSPYCLRYLEEFSTILMAYEPDEEAQRAALDVLLGRKKAQGKLPVTASPCFRAQIGSE